MAITLQQVQDPYNSFIGDSSSDRITQTERFNFFTEATNWLQTELDNDHSVRTYGIKYYDTINYYKINSAISDVLEGNALRRARFEDDVDITRKDARQIAIDISERQMESGYALERRDGDLYLAVNHDSKYRAMIVSHFDSLTADGGTWVADTVNSDAANLAVDPYDGSDNTTGCLSFDVIAGQSANNRATISNNAVTQEDLTADKNLVSFLLDVKFPSVANITSVTLYWGSDSSNYYTSTQTTNYDGSAFTADFNNTVKFDWLGTTTVVGTPVITAVDYLRIDINYSAGQTSMSGFKVDNLRMVRPEKLTFSYTSWNVGTDTSGTPLKLYGALTDIPYYSGQYDDYRFAVAHKAAALTFKSLRLYVEASYEDNEATSEMNRIRKVIPKSRPTEMKQFKILGISFARGRRSRRFR